MQLSPITAKKHLPAAPKQDVPFAANEVRLSPRQVLAALVVLAGLSYVLPIVWQRVEPLQITPDYRIPYRLGNDYWAYERYCSAVCRLAKTLVLGDSVVWGHYVRSDETLSHYLNQQAGGQRFANIGVDGIHPLAMTGLVEYYGRAITRHKVILGCNLLWMSSKRHDLQSEKEFAFNHPALVPQFFPRIACYRAPLSTRLAIVLGRSVPLFGWADHLRTVLLEGNDLPHWAIEHPYGWPGNGWQAPSPDEPLSPPPVAKPWSEQGIKQFSPSWVELGTSLQWRSFRQTAKLLEARGNRVFVLLGPFNEHMLTAESLQTYRQRQKEVETWLRAEQIPYYIPQALPSRYYADASHPLAEGYAQLARQMCGDKSFRQFNAEP